RVARWISERPGVDRDEFIDDIPFPETQDYVKKIIGQAEDYRRLYGPGAPADDDESVKPAAAAPGKSSSASNDASASKKATAKKTPAAKPRPKSKKKSA